MKVVREGMSDRRTSILKLLRNNYYVAKSQFPENTKRKNYFLAACAFWLEDEEIVEANEKCPFGGLIGMGNSQLWLENLLNKYKVFRLHAIFHDAAGFVRSEYGTGPGYMYVCETRLNSCFLGHISGISYCFMLKLSRK